MNLIQQEALCSKMFELEEDDGLVKLSAKNVAVVEAMLRANSDYARAQDVEQYEGRDGRHASTAYWMTQLKKYFLGDARLSRETLFEMIIAAVDRDNSTHLNTDKCGRDIILKRLLELSDDELIEGLKYPKETDYRLISVIAARTKSQKGGRTNVSFASKFCHYACFYMFEGEKEQDNYSIYDNIVKAMLPKYLALYGLPAYKLDDYREYQNAIDALIARIGFTISRNGLDHLIWYSGKR